MTILKFIGLAIGLLTIAVWIWGRVIPHTISTDEYFGLPDDEIISTIFPRYPLPREIHWSGIFPIFGGLIEDPHMTKTKMITVLIQSNNIVEGEVDIQGIETNFFFAEKYQTSQLFIRNNSNLHTYTIAGLKILNMGKLDHFIFLGEFENQMILYFGNSYDSQNQYGGAIIKVELPFVSESHSIIFESQETEWFQILDNLKLAGSELKSIVELCALRGGRGYQVGLYLSQNLCN